MKLSEQVLQEVVPGPDTKGVDLRLLSRKASRRGVSQSALWPALREAVKRGTVEQLERRDDNGTRIYYRRVKC